MIQTINGAEFQSAFKNARRGRTCPASSASAAARHPIACWSACSKGRHRVAASLAHEWLDAHAVEIKPKTLADHRHLIERHVKPNIGGLRLQAVRPGQVTKLYRDLVTTGGRRGTGLSPRTVSYVHAVLHKAFEDAALVEQVIPSNPVERAKRPRRRPAQPGEVRTAAELRAFLKVAETHRLFAFFPLAAYTGARRGELLNLRRRLVDLDGASVQLVEAAEIFAKHVEDVA